MIRVMGIIGIVIGLTLIIMTAAGSIYHDKPAQGYIVGGILAIAGVLRFLRGTNR